MKRNRAIRIAGFEKEVSLPPGDFEKDVSLLRYDFAKDVSLPRHDFVKDVWLPRHAYPGSRPCRAPPWTLETPQTADLGTLLRPECPLRPDDTSVLEPPMSLPGIQFCLHLIPL